MKAIRMFSTIAEDYRLQVISVSSILMTILILYRQDFLILANEATTNEAMSHILLVPLLASFLIYRKRNFVRATLELETLRARTKIISLSNIAGIAFCLCAFLLYWYGSYTFYSLEYHVLSLVVFLLGMILILFNFKTLMVVVFPVLFLLFLVPPPSPLTFTAGAILGNFNSHASYTLLRIAGLPIALSSEYGSPTIEVNNAHAPDVGLEFAVDVSCSGIYSLVAFTMFGAFLVYIARGSISKKIALFPLGFTLLVVLNIIRISLIAFIAYHLGKAIALAVFHLFSGWFLVFFGIFMLLLISEKFLHLKIFLSKNKTSSDPNCDHKLDNNKFCLCCGNLTKNHHIKLTKRFWIKIIALFFCTYFVTLVIQAPVFVFVQRLTISDPNPGENIEAFPQVVEYRPHFLNRYRDFERVSGQDISLLYIYMSRNMSQPSVYALVGVSGSRTSLHGWEQCLYAWRIAHGYAPLVEVLESRQVQLIQDPSITAHWFVFQDSANHTQYTLYWYLRALFNTGSTIVSKYVRISLIVFTQNPNEYADLEQELLSMGKAIVSYWEPTLEKQSIVSLSIPTMQILLVSTIAFGTIIQATHHMKEWRRKTTNLKIFERMASPKEKLLCQTIKAESEKTKETTTRNIAKAFRKVMDKAVKTEELIDMLNNLEKSGIIKVDVISIQDQPKLVWKP